MRFKVSLPAASIGAKCFSVVSLHANGREDSLAAKTWLICGSVHPPLFALSSFLQMLIPFTNRCKYAAFCEIVSALSGFCIIRLPVNCSYNSHYEKRGSEEVCIDDEIPFEIPENWAWCRFETATLYVTDYVANGSFASLRENVKTYKEENYALMVKTQDFSNDFTRGLTYTDQKGFDYLQKSRLYGGELMLSNIGASIGKAFIVPTMNIRMTLAPNAIVVKCLDAIMTEYLRYFILSYYGQKMLSDFTAGTAMPKFSKTQLRSALIPVPPYSEQRRIIEKIKQLDVLVCTL